MALKSIFSNKNPKRRSRDLNKSISNIKNMAKSKAKTTLQINLATSEAPAQSLVGETEKERLHLSPAEFRVQLKALGEEVRNLVKIARKVGSLKSGQYIEVAGAKFGAKELNKLVFNHVKTLKTLSKNYTARGQKKKKGDTKANRTGEGFAKGSFFEAPLISFLKKANFGSQNAAIHAQIDPLLDQGVLSRGILTPLLTTYMFANNLRFEDNGKIFYRVNAEMNEALGPYISEVETTDTGSNKKGNARAKFVRNKFVYNRLQSIVNPGIREKANLTQDELDYVNNQAVIDALAAAQKAVSEAEKVEKAKQMA